MENANSNVEYIPEVISAQSVYPRAMVIAASTREGLTLALRREALRMYGGFEWDGRDLVLEAGMPNEGTAWKIRLQNAR